MDKIFTIEDLQPPVAKSNPGVVHRLKDTSLVTALLQHPTEDNVALAFRERHTNEYVYLHGRGKWYKWDGKRWMGDTVGVVKHCIRNLARFHNQQGNAAPAKNSFVVGVENLLRSDPAFSRDAAAFDQDNYLLNCPNGTYDLRTGRRQPHAPEDCITMSTAVAPSKAGGERFLRFLDEITLGDKELQSFLQRSLGACLSGAVEEHWLMFWIGLGRNGKNTLGEAVLSVMGDYARPIPSSTLMSQKHQSHPTEIMSLKGMRLVTSGEIEEGSFWAESKIKELSGDEFLSGHYMRQDWVSFPRTHKHLIYGNYRPQLRNVDVGIRSRLKIVPFRACFQGKEDPNLKADLEREGSHILYWLMKGHRMWLENGKRVGTCQAVEDEAKDYYESQSTIDTWINECCDLEPVEGQPGRHWPKASELYRNYTDWKEERGERPMTQTRFGEQLSRKHQKLTAAGVRYTGLQIKLPSVKNWGKP